MIPSGSRVKTLLTSPFFTGYSQTKRFAFSKPQKAPGTAKGKPLALWSPHPKNRPQNEFVASLADETFYGGAAMGGKTDGVIGIAVMQHRRSLILRKEFTQLRSMIDRTREVIGEHGRLNENTGIYRLNDGRVLEFGSCPHEKDKAKFKGRAHDLKAFDEVTEFSQSEYEFIIKWNRTAVKGQRCRVIATFNPPTMTEGGWIRDYLKPWFAYFWPEHFDHPNPAAPGELRWFAVMDGKMKEVESGEPFEHNGETVYPRSRTFIPAKVHDNPYAGSDYVAVLQAGDELTRRQLLEGDMSAGLRDDEWQLVPSAWILAAEERWRERKAQWESGEGERPPLRAMGADVAQGGDDDTVIARSFGSWVDELTAIPGRETPKGVDVADAVERLWTHIDDKKAVPICVDAVGVGQAPYQEMERRGHRVYGVNAGESSKAFDKNGIFGFSNKRAELLWRVRELLDPEGDDPIAIPPDAALRQEMTSTRYQHSPSGIQIEKKDVIKSRIGRSPDKLDALSMLCEAMTQYGFRGR